MKKVILALVAFSPLIGCGGSGGGGGGGGGYKGSPAMTVEVSSLNSPTLMVKVEDQTINLGTLSATGGSTLEVMIDLKNSSTTPVSVDWSLILGKGFNFTTTTCSAVVAPQATCRVHVLFNPSAQKDGEKNVTFMIENGSNSITVNLRGRVSGNPVANTGGVADLQLTMLNPFNDPGLPYREMKIKNVGSGVAIIDNISLSPDYVIRLNKCPTELEVGQECGIEVLYRDYANSSPTDETLFVESSSTNGTPAMKEFRLLDGITI